MFKNGEMHKGFIFTPNFPYPTPFKPLPLTEWEMYEYAILGGGKYLK